MKTNFLVLALLSIATATPGLAGSITEPEANPTL